jgi:hypothetical protein
LEFVKEFGEVDKLKFGGGHKKSTKNSIKFAIGMWHHLYQNDR